MRGTNCSARSGSGIRRRDRRIPWRAAELCHLDIRPDMFDNLNDFRGLTRSSAHALLFLAADGLHEDAFQRFRGGIAAEFLTNGALAVRAHLPAGFRVGGELQHSVR